MYINKAIFFIPFLTVAIQASQELENIIIKTDLEAVKKILPTITLDLETKQHLVDLANDIMLMRIKTEEIYSFKDINDQDKESLKKDLSKKTIQEIKQLNDTISSFVNIFFLSTITGIISPIFAEPRFHSEIVSAIGSTSCLLSIIVICIATFGIADTTKILQSKIRSNLHQLYQDSIEIKHLIACAPIK
jgi:hypothetical protein